MRIGIDARMIENSGIGTYLKNLIYWLPKISNYDYVLFGSQGNLERFNIPLIEANYPIYGLKEQILLPSVIKKAKVDLFHSPHYVIPILYTGKLVVTIHDLIHLIFPEYLSSKISYYYAKFMVAAACKKAVRIITVSKNTKNDIMKYFNVPDSKISITYHGADAIPQCTETKKDDPQKKYGKYILYVGLIRPHKNILRLIEAFRWLKKKNAIEHKLILLGKGKFPYISKVKKKISDSSLKSEIFIIEENTYSELAAFYRGADLFVFPSLYEGFGLPPLEAMACGCPVIASATSSIPEVVGDAALTINPYDEREISDAILKITSDSAFRKSLIEKGNERVKLFSWKKTAEETIKIYKEVLN